MGTRGPFILLAFASAAAALVYGAISVTAEAPQLTAAPTMTCTATSTFGFGSLGAALRKKGHTIQLALDIVEGAPRDKLVKRQILEGDFTEHNVGDAVGDFSGEELLIYDAYPSGEVVFHASMASVSVTLENGDILKGFRRFEYLLYYPNPVALQEGQLWNLTLILMDGKREIVFPKISCRKI